MLQRTDKFKIEETDLGDLEDSKFDSETEIYSNKKFYNQEYYTIDYRVDFNSCYFEKIDFSKLNLDGYIFSNCYFKNCDFSNSSINSAGIHKCTFENSKFVGTDIIGTSMKNNIFLGGTLHYLNLNKSSLINIKFDNSDLSMASINEVSLKNVIFDECKLLKADLHHTKLRNIDLSTSSIEDVNVTLDDLIGCKINSFQAINIMISLGIDVVI